MSSEFSAEAGDEHLAVYGDQQPTAIPSAEERLAALGLADQIYIRRLARKLRRSDEGRLYSHVPIAPVKNMLRRHFVRQFGQNHSLVLASYKEQFQTPPEQTESHEASAESFNS